MTIVLLQALISIMTIHFDKATITKFEKKRRNLRRYNHLFPSVPVPFNLIHALLNLFAYFYKKGAEKLFKVCKHHQVRRKSLYEELADIERLYEDKSMIGNGLLEASRNVCLTLLSREENIQKSLHGESLVHILSKDKHLSTLQFVRRHLLRKELMSVRTEANYTPLHIAIRHANVELLGDLLDSSDYSGFTEVVFFLENCGFWKFNSDRGRGRPFKKSTVFDFNFSLNILF